MSSWTIEEMMDDLEYLLKDFQWAYPNREYNRGEITVDRENHKLILVVWTQDNENPEQEEIGPLDVVTDITLNEDAEQQIRGLIHWYLCHEADEQMWFGNDRIFYPHHEVTQ